jgi:hypothetical protein
MSACMYNTLPEVTVLLSALVLSVRLCLTDVRLVVLTGTDTDVYLPDAPKL